MIDQEVLVVTESELLVEGGSDELLVESVVQREVVVDQSTELLVEEFLASEVIEIPTTDMVVETVETNELLEIGVQGPPGPRGVQGIQGPSGVSTVGGFDVEILDPQPGDHLALNPSMQWMNDRVLDGGNF